MTLRVLDLFSGLEGASQAFRDRGHEVITLDVEPAFEPTICKNILHVTAEELAEYGPYDFIWGSPPVKRSRKSPRNGTGKTVAPRITDYIEETP